MSSLCIPNLTKVRDMKRPELRRPVTGQWEEFDPKIPLARAWINSELGLKVLVTSDVMDDGSRWLHVSVSRRDRIPSWNDLKETKDMFIGRNAEAIQVLPRDRDYVNLHPFCLHLWSPES